jgi:ABC-type nitrate/sulfonate/bicarbonate transport system substrate-binding protein
MISRMNDEVRTISSGRDGSWFAVKSNRSETSTMFRIFMTLCLVVGAAPTLAGETLRTGLQRTGTFAWQLDVIRRHGLASSAGLDLKISEYASPDAGKLALNSGSVDLAVVDWLWVCACRKSNPNILVVQPAQDRAVFG